MGGGKSRGIFLDRDGTLCENGAGYVGEEEKIVPCKGASRVLGEMVDGGYKLFLVTNQSGVGRGFFPLGSALACNRRLLDLLGHGNIFTEICLSTGTPHSPDSYRKPSPRFILEMCAKYDMDVASCWVIGDSSCDVEMAKNAGANAIVIDANANEPDSVGRPQLLFRPDLESAWEAISVWGAKNIGT
ncbi:MAG: HAD-IIIA family hydrolase [Puniceicoccales bacterium]|jgi:D-glycero-D-manno-heptose 1,7-bisphosphate phosphatase|nr:HAD-IIIA family hydrolase [Puniceicoccales bacterium]